MYGSAVRGNPERIMATLLEFRQDAGRLCRRAQAGLDILLSSPEVDGRIGAVGYCFGGMTVLELPALAPIWPALSAFTAVWPAPIRRTPAR
jgi:dienelactone hydrolase